MLALRKGNTTQHDFRNVYVGSRVHPHKVPVGSIVQQLAAALAPTNGEALTCDFVGVLFARRGRAIYWLGLNVGGKPQHGAAIRVSGTLVRPHSYHREGDQYPTLRHRFICSLTPSTHTLIQHRARATAQGEFSARGLPKPPPSTYARPLWPSVQRSVRTTSSTRSLVLQVTSYLFLPLLPHDVVHCQQDPL